MKSTITLATFSTDALSAVWTKPCSRMIESRSCWILERRQAESGWVATRAQFWRHWLLFPVEPGVRSLLSVFGNSFTRTLQDLHGIRRAIPRRDPRTSNSRKYNYMRRLPLRLSMDLFEISCTCANVSNPVRLNLATAAKWRL